MSLDAINPILCNHSRINKWPLPDQTGLLSFICQMAYISQHMLTLIGWVSCLSGSLSPLIWLSLKMPPRSPPSLSQNRTGLNFGYELRWPVGFLPYLLVRKGSCLTSHAIHLSADGIDGQSVPTITWPMGLQQSGFELLPPDHSLILYLSWSLTSFLSWSLNDAPTVELDRISAFPAQEIVLFCSAITQWWTKTRFPRG